MINKDIKSKEKRRVTYVNLICESCKNNFDIPPNLYKLRLKNSKNFFCSKKCSQIFRKNKPNNIVYTKELKEKLSFVQKNKIISEQSLQILKESGKKSKNLFKKGHKIHELYPELKNKILTTQKKDTHWNWKGGITKEVRVLRSSKKYINWRNDVFKRDIFSCKECGASNCLIHAHHIVTFSSLFHEKNFNKLWDTENGITLCTNCHYQKHKGPRKDIYE
jgi:hypothetical protein